MEQLKRFVVNLDEKITETRDDISEIKQILTGQAADLKYHIRRTDLAEQNIEMLRQEQNKNTAFRARVEWTFKLIGVGCSGLGLMFAGAKAVELLMKYL